MGAQANHDIDFKKAHDLHKKRKKKKKKHEKKAKKKKNEKKTGDVTTITDKFQDHLSSDEAEQITANQDDAMKTINIEMAPLTRDALGSMGNEEEADLAEIPVVTDGEGDESDEDSSELSSDDSEKRLLGKGKEE